jgi:hypothetical protein
MANVLEHKIEYSCTATAVPIDDFIHAFAVFTGVNVLICKGVTWNNSQLMFAEQTLVSYVDGVFDSYMDGLSSSYVDCLSAFSTQSYQTPNHPITTPVPALYPLFTRSVPALYPLGTRWYSYYPQLPWSFRTLCLCLQFKDSWPGLTVGPSFWDYMFCPNLIPKSAFFEHPQTPLYPSSQ